MIEFNAVKSQDETLVSNGSEPSVVNGRDGKTVEVIVWMPADDSKVSDVDGLCIREWMGGAVFA